jgi:methylated-DNA-[protein]-cysteine S-methyltransferase
LPILLPCHRVTGADGELGGYSGEGGTETKRRLLTLEKAILL